MNELDTTVVTSITHGHFDTLLKSGFKPDYIEDPDAKAIWFAAADMIHRTPPVRPNRLNLLSATTGQLQNLQDVREILSLNGSGESAPETVVARSYDRYLLRAADDAMRKFDQLKRTKPGEIKLWLPTVAQELELVATTGYAYNPSPEAHDGKIVAPVMFQSGMDIYNDMYAGNAGDGGGYREGWWVVWLGVTGQGKTTGMYTQARDVISLKKKQVFISKENQSQIKARILLALTALTRKEVEDKRAIEMEPIHLPNGEIYSIEGYGAFHKQEVRQAIFEYWNKEVNQYLRLYDWTFAKKAHIKAIIATEDPDVLDIDYFDPNDVAGTDKVNGLAKISGEMEQIAHNTGTHINGLFQISADERKKYERNDFHDIVGPYGSSGVTHPADQVFQTKRWKEPYTQHYRRTKCRAQGLNKNWVAGYDQNRWAFYDIPQLSSYNQISR